MMSTTVMATSMARSTAVMPKRAPASEREKRADEKADGTGCEQHHAADPDEHGAVELAVALVHAALGGEQQDGAGDERGQGNERPHGVRSPCLAGRAACPARAAPAARPDAACR